MSGYTLDLRPSSPLYQKVLEGLNSRYTFSAQRMSNLHDKWRRSEDLFIAYVPEKDADATRRMKREQQGKPDYTTIVLPYTYAQLMSAHSYWTSVFLSRDPVFQFAGRHGETEQQTQAMEALMAYQVQVGEMMVPFYFWLLDAGKYGIGVLGNYWANEQTSISEYTEVDEILLGMPTGRKVKDFSTRMEQGYQGNKLYNTRPYDWYPDPRVPLWNFQKGEFQGSHHELGWHQLVRAGASGQFINVDLVKKLKLGGRWTGREQGSPNMELPNDTSSTPESGLQDLADTGPYGVMVMEVDIIPSEWGLSKVNTPEKWVFSGAVNGGAPGNARSGQNIQVLLEARPLGCKHNKFRCNVIEMEPEAYALGSRSLPQIIEPLQNTMDWLVNSHMYAVRKTLNNQFIVDPSKIVMSDFTEPTHGGAIRMKPNAYGTDLRQAVYQLPVVDLTRQHMADTAMFNDFAQRASGINDQLMGQVNSGGRKTAQEIRTSSTFGINRQKTISEFYSHMGFSPLAQILVQNSQQYYDQSLKLKIVGDLVLEAGQSFMMVDPASISGAFDFVPVDGTMPIDRFQMASLWQQLFSSIMKVPQVAQTYDIGRVFGWVAQLSGLRNINRFKIVVAQPGQTPAAAAGANVVPLRDITRTPEPGQMPGMGTTG